MPPGFCSGAAFCANAEGCANEAFCASVEIHVRVEFCDKNEFCDQRLPDSGLIAIMDADRDDCPTQISRRKK